MYLKRLEMIGFKSFADRTELEFAPGITVFAGPNGSGKSNISDAVRFALGEQSTKVLRATRMEETIFGGSRSRKAVGMAEVTMVFDNSDRYFPLDFSEIAITRRIFRGGDTQYSINKSPCRWRDIQELFMDTGIGHGALCLVGGREVDMVLSSNPHDRRLILEETAGVNKYFFRKKEATRKLEQTGANLLRLKDIQGEITASLKAAEAQVARCNRYRKYQDRLAGLESRFTRSQARCLGDVRAERLAAQRGLRAQLAEVLDGRKEQELEIESLRSEYESQGLTIEKYRHGMAEIALQTGHLRHEAEQVDERLASLLLDRESAAAHGEDTARRLEQMDVEAETFRCELEKLAKDERALSGQALRLEEALAALAERLGEREPDLVELRKALDGVLQERFVLSERLAHVRSSAERLDERSEKSRAELAGHEAAKDALLAKLDEAKASADALDGALRAAVEEREKLGALRQDGERELQEASRQLTGARDALVQYSSRLDALRELADTYSDYFPGVRYLMSRRRQFPAIVGTLADLIEVPGEYEKAFEVILAGHLQDIVIASSADAKACLEILKREKAGRVTFWPLDLPRKARGDHRILKGSPGVVGWAKHLITFDSRVDTVLEILLGKTLVVKSIDTALDFYRRTMKGDGFLPSLVSLDGDVLSPSGSMTGGAMAHARKGILARRREAEELEAQVKQLKARLEELEKGRRILQDTLSATTAKLQECEKSCRRLEAERGSAFDVMQELTRRVAELERALERCRLEGAELQEEQDALSARSEEIAGRLERSHPREEELEARIAELGSELKEEQAERDDLSRRIAECRVTLARTVEKAAALKEKSQMYAARRGELTVELEESGKKLQSLSAERERFTARKRELDFEKSRLALRHGGYEKLVEEVERDRVKLTERLARAQEQLQERTERSGSLQEQIHRLDIEMAQLTTQLEELMARMAGDAGDGGEVRVDEAPILDEEETQKELARLRGVIASFGGVNLGAQEDYEKLKERHEFLQAQVRDLEDASASLREVISQMDETSTQKFRAAFDAVNAQFSETFTELFNGGSAMLELSDPGNALDSGVEIVARPPGKKLQNLTLLSSGERALTATAFLMALLKVKPSPFVILDELDAPLDDSNVERVADKFRELSAASQFIIITHNRKTMEYGSALYGVTMEEAGVSRLVSLNLEETAGRRGEATRERELVRG